MENGREGGVRRVKFEVAAVSNEGGDSNAGPRCSNRRGRIAWLKV